MFGFLYSILRDLPLTSTTQPPLTVKWRNLTLLAIAELLAMTMWFSSSAVVPQLSAHWHLNEAQKAWVTMSVQIGFVLGAVISAVLNLADRIDSRKLFAVCAFIGAGANAAIPFFDVDFPVALVCRILTGVCLAGVYPPGMKLMATWCKEDRGLGIGLLVGALTFGSAVPHLLNALTLSEPQQMPDWQPVMYLTSGQAIVAAIIAGFCVQTGPHLGKSAPFNAQFALDAFRYKPTRLANFGYLGHMWELYAVWAWVPIFLKESYKASEWDSVSAGLAGFGTVAIGAVGCIFAGLLADRIGRTTTAISSLLVSGICCLVAGFLFDYPGILTALCLIWGFAVVADSAQFSTAISELADSRYVGTALTVQTSLGFLLTLLTIQLIPLMRQWQISWQGILPLLALGPIFGIWSMWRLRYLPEAAQMASGNR